MTATLATPAAVSPAVTDAQATPAKPAAKRTRKPAAAKPKPTPVVSWDDMSEADQIAAVRIMWTDAGTNEVAAKTHLDAARIAHENTRVIRCRVAYRAAMIKPIMKAGVATPNVLNAARILASNPDDTAAARTAAARKAKSQTEYYIRAGVALADAGLAMRETEPDANERKIVADALKAAADAAKAAKDNKGIDLGGTGAGEGDTPADSNTPANEAVTYNTMVEHLARIEATFKLLKQNKAVISEDDAANFAAMLETLEEKVTAYAKGK